MTEPQTLHTDRLSLRPLTRADAADLFPLFSDAETMRYWHTLPHQDKAETATMLDGMLSHEAACWWAVCLHGTHHAIGCLGFLGNTGIPGFGYILRSDYWRRGLMSEAARAAIGYGFGELKLDRIELWIHHENAASLKLAERLGFTYRGRLRQKYPGRASAHDTLVYGVSAVAWSHQQPAERTALYRLEPVLPVREVAAASAYYRDKLGFTVDFIYGDPPSHATVFRGAWSPEGARIQLSRASEVAPATLYIFVGDGLERLHEEYRAKGVTVLSPPTSHPWGMREFAVEDADGHSLRFGTPV